MRQRKPRDRARTGVVTVEFAAVAPVLFLLVLGTIETGRALMASHSLEEASRSGCRIAILKGATTQEIENDVRRILAPVGISAYSVQVQPAGYALADRWTPVTVSVSASFNDMCWLPLPRFITGKTYTASCTQAKEFSPGS
ncbi:MAG: TadE family protein [Planctomycetota bacterium]